MPEVDRTQLPGVGPKIEFVSEEGNRLGVIHHRAGRRELFVFSDSDPDAVALSLSLTDDESHALADALGGSSIVESLESMAQEVDGLAVDWINIPASAPLAGQTIGDARIRTRTGVSVVAVLRDGSAHPSPSPEFSIKEGDTILVVGTSQGVESVRTTLAMA